MRHLSVLLIFLVTFIVIYAEAAFTGTRHLLGAQIDLLPALMVYTGLTNGLPVILALSICAGLGFDSLSANPLGTSIMPLFLVGYFIHRRSALVLRDQLYAQFVLGGIASALVPLAEIIILSCSREVPLIGWGTLWQWLVMTAGGCVLTPVVFKLFDRLNSSFNYRPIVETSFRLDRQISRGRN